MPRPVGSTWTSERVVTGGMSIYLATPSLSSRPALLVFINPLVSNVCLICARRRIMRPPLWTGPSPLAWRPGTADARPPRTLRSPRPPEPPGRPRRPALWAPWARRAGRPCRRSGKPLVRAGRLSRYPTSAEEARSCRLLQSAGGFDIGLDAGHLLRIGPAPADRAGVEHRLAARPVPAERSTAVLPLEGLYRRQDLRVPARELPDQLQALGSAVRASVGPMPALLQTSPVSSTAPRIFPNLFRPARNWRSEERTLLVPRTTPRRFFLMSADQPRRGARRCKAPR